MKFEVREYLITKYEVQRDLMGELESPGADGPVVAPQENALFHPKVVQQLCTPPPAM